MIDREKVIKAIKETQVDYDAPISIITKMADAVAKFTDDGVMKAVASVGFDIDRDKLFQALQQDRQRYEEAYRRGYEKREEEIIRCKDCKWNNGYTGCDKYLIPHGGDWFCADGVKRE